MIWEPLLAELARLRSVDAVVCPQLPGFGRPAPPGFGATKEEYADWLTDVVEEISARSGPVDLVGHDWGCGFVMRVAATGRT